MRPFPRRRSLMIRAHAGSAQEGDWRSRVLDMALRTIRASPPARSPAWVNLEEGPWSASWSDQRGRPPGRGRGRARPGTSALALGL